MTDTPTPQTTPQTQQDPPPAQQTPQNPPPAAPEATPGPEGVQPEPAAEIARLQAENARLRVAAETGVPLPLLTATDEAQLRDQAAAIRAYADTASQRPHGAPPPTPITPDAPSTDPLGDLLRR